MRMAPALLMLMLAGCGGNLDSEMWGCQLEVQKGNAGRSADAQAEKSRDIEACMETRGYQRNSRKSSCPPGTTRSACYQAR